MKLSVVEPLKMLFKDEVRRVGKSLGIENKLLKRHPFPGPGLAIRILGDITNEKVRILQEVDYIFISALLENDLYDKVWQAGAILLPAPSNILQVFITLGMWLSCIYFYVLCWVRKGQTLGMKSWKLHLYSKKQQDLTMKECF